MGGRFQYLPSFLKMVDPLTGNKRSAPQAESIFSDRWLGLKTLASQSTVPYQLTRKQPNHTKNKTDVKPKSSSFSEKSTYFIPR